MTQTQLVKQVITGRQMSIKEVSSETGIQEPNIRRILGQGTKKGEFTRIAKGIYTIVIGDKTKAIISTSDSLKTIHELSKVDYKFDMVFLDIPYNTPAVKGGNRGVKYDLISVEEFDHFIKGLKKLIHKDTAIYHMYSQAPSGWKKMKQYNDVLESNGLIKVSEGYWQKTFKDGKPCTNVRGVQSLPEGLSLYNLSGDVPLELTMKFTSVRPRTASQKCSKMIEKLIQQSTKVGQRILDPFAGTGVTGEAALKLLRNVMLIEKSKDRVDNEIIPLLKLI